MSALGVYGMSALTALTAQNTQGVTAVQLVTPDMVAPHCPAPDGSAQYLTCGPKEFDKAMAAMLVDDLDVPADKIFSF